MSKNHQAIITKIKVSDHPNADRLQIGYCCHETVIVGLDVKDGDLGIYFPPETQLSMAFAQVNDLIRRKDAQGNPMGGLFENNRRVRVQKIRGVNSSGFWCPITHLSTFGDTSILKDGDQLDQFNKHDICCKYISRRNPYGKNSRQGVCRKKEICFPEHLDTSQFKYNSNAIRTNDELILTEKMEGTSQRAGYVLVNRKLGWFEKFLKRWLNVNIAETEMNPLNGTRRVVLKDDSEGYHCPDLRKEAAQKIQPFLEEHMIVYFEVVGYEKNGASIMPAQNMEKTKDKTIIDRYGKSVVYAYGNPVGEHSIYVYRICYVLPNGKTIDLSWDEVKEKCTNWGVRYTPEICRLKYVNHLPQTKFEFDNIDELIKYVDSISDGPSSVDDRHPMEGVCVRVNKPGWHVYKNKGWTYKVGADIVKINPNYVDIEEES